ncbi:MAG: two-component system, cell cycle sensor histidine kinase and response regulator CckA [Gemmatimonadales bacterium]|nr:two-component system, cell cycle sensor histidine kinase and response regulator CckA [Gemmatimonadales bacterium]
MVGLALGAGVVQRWHGRRAHEGERVRRFYDALSCGIIVQDASGKVVHANQAARDLLGTTDVVLAGSPGADHRVVHEDGSSAEGDAHPLSLARRTGQPVRGAVHGVFTGTAEERWCLVDAVPVFDPATGSLVEAVASLTDITQRRRAETALLNTTDTLSALIQASPLAIFAFDPAGKITSWNSAAERLFGWRASEVLGHTLPAIAPDQRQAFRVHHLAVLEGKSFIDLEARWQRRDGRPVTLNLALAPLYGGLSEVRGVMVLAADLTERKKLESQLRQSQKMEAVGQLAGGVAHDFNNLLTAIIGYTSLLLKAVPPGDQKHEDLLEIDRAAARATELTQQLLAFSRRQMLQPTLLDLNAVLSDTMRMLGRLLGEHIELAILPDPGLGVVRADRGQLEQVIINLAVNARDAMEAGGRLTLETMNVSLDRAYVSQHPGAAEGEYVMLAVTDSGMGMDGATQARIFEPFFTTKERGKGTGLGLSTVYGIVKQSGGTIYVYSEPERGTTFKIYLPRVMAAGPTKVSPPVRPTNVRGTETVLVVEDEEGVRSLTCRVLRTYGYTVLEAENGGEALLIAEQHLAPIHLLLTDVVLPRMSGRKLAERLVRVCSDLRVLYMSGYTDASIVNHGALDPGAEFLQKPFTPEVLAQKLRAVLDSPAASVPPA